MSFLPPIRKKPKQMLAPQFSLSSVKFESPKFFILPTSISQSRLSRLDELSRKAGFNISQTFSDDVSLLVTDLKDINNAQHQSIIQSCIKRNIPIVNSNWISESLQKRQPSEFETFRISIEDKHQDHIEVSNVSLIADYACQRPTPLNHHNKLFTEALEFLEDYATIVLEDSTRALAFRKASCVLKQLPFKLKEMATLHKLKNVGNHSRQVIGDILSSGCSEEVSVKQNDENYVLIKKFTSIYGVGAKTSKKWISQGIRNFEDIDIESLDERQKSGLKYREDLNIKITISEANVVAKVVDKLLSAIDSRLKCLVVGGFSRGKLSGHDVDLLINNNSALDDDILFQKLILHLKENDLILFSGLNTVANVKLDHSSVGTLDGHNRAFSIFKLCEDDTYDNGGEWTHGARSWIARRVDFIVVPPGQYFYALRGWIGSKHFNRQISLYADKVCNMKLSNHGLFDRKTCQWLSASSQEAIFSHLNLPYIEPCNRNC